jgi:hypothetical protein
MRSSYLTVVTLYIHFFGVDLDQALFSYRCPEQLPSSFDDASRRCNQPVHDRAASILSVLNLNPLALLILKATGLALTCELPQLYLGRQMV